MIRDPSDGAVRGMPVVEDIPADPQIADIIAAILVGKVKPERVSQQWEYQRAWNDGIDFALRQIKEYQGRGK